MLQAASPALQSGASQLCFAAAAWDAPPSLSLNCPPPPPAKLASGDDRADLADSPDGSNRTLTLERLFWTECVGERAPVTRLRTIFSFRARSIERNSPISAPETSVEARPVEPIRPVRPTR